MSLLTTGNIYMEGVCKCGGRIKESTHEVKTLDGARKWLPECQDGNIPLTIRQSRCAACWRTMTEVKDGAGGGSYTTPR